LEQEFHLNFYKLVIEYKGTAYQGFQVQPDHKTIQGEINRALKLISKSEEIHSIGSGRTDAGVHALNQVLRVGINLEINPQNLVKALNTKLPNDIRVKKSEVCTEEFHPIFLAKSKEYNYVFSTKEIPSVFCRDLMATFDFEFKEELIKEACTKFIGTFDFSNYQCVGTDVKSSVREIYECELVKHQGSGFLKEYIDEYYVIRVVGNGFLKQMVRLMVGALWNVGRGKITIKDLEASLLHKSDVRLGAVAPPEGLYLKEVHY
jgi:tRNA pseudouridine38-40 synthase